MIKKMRKKDQKTQEKNYGPWGWDARCRTEPVGIQRRFSEASVARGRERWSWSADAEAAMRRPIPPGSLVVLVQVEGRAAVKVFMAVCSPFLGSFHRWWRGRLGRGRGRSGECGGGRQSPRAGWVLGCAVTLYGSNSQTGQTDLVHKSGPIRQRTALNESVTDRWATTDRHSLDAPHASNSWELSIWIDTRSSRHARCIPAMTIHPPTCCKPTTERCCAFV